jgi:RNA polymerase sigma factor (sigma-70 family)
VGKYSRLKLKKAIGAAVEWFLKHLCMPVNKSGSAMKTKNATPISAYRKLSDEELIRRYVQLHEGAAFKCLFERYAHAVLGICLSYRTEREPATNRMESIFISLLKEPHLGDIEDFKSWLYRCAHSRCIDKAGDNDTAIIQSGIAQSEVPGSKRQASPHFNGTGSAFAALPNEQRACLDLFYNQHKSFREIAAHTGYALNEVRTAIASGRELLQHHWIVK